MTVDEMSGCRQVSLGPNVLNAAIKCCLKGAAILSIMTHSTMTLSIKGLFVTLSINDTA